MNISYEPKNKRRVSIKESVEDRSGIESRLYTKLRKIIYDDIDRTFDIDLFNEDSYEEIFVDGWDLFYSEAEDALKANQEMGQLVLISISNELPAKQLVNRFLSITPIKVITYREYYNYLYVLGYLR